MAIERDWYTTEEAARELGLAASTIRGAAMRGILKVEVVAPRVRAITREELDRYRAEHLGKNWEARRSGTTVEGSRATYHRAYYARRKAQQRGDLELAEDAEISACPADMAAPHGAAAG